MKQIIYLLGLPTIFLLAFSFGFAQETQQATQSTPPEYQPLASVPGLNPGTGPQALGQYINSIYTLSIGIGAVLAVLMIVIGGLQYMGTDIFSKKGEGRTRITNAGLGLGLLLASFLILQTINNNLTSLEVNIERAESTATLSELLLATGGNFDAELYCQEFVPGVPDTGRCHATEAECVAAYGLVDLEIFGGCKPFKQNVEFVGCDSCEPIEEFDATFGLNACQTGGGTIACSASAELKEPINQTANITGSEVIITEAWPPTINHKATCHKDGNCIDFDLASPTPQNISNTIQTWDALGGQAVYEVKTQGEKDEILDALSLRDKERVKDNICVFSQITGSHFSGYAQAGSQDTSIRQCRRG